MFGKMIFALAALGTAMAAHAQDGDDWTLVIHGGAGVLERGSMSPEYEAGQHAALKAALEAGKAVLVDGGTSLDAVQAAIRVLEDHPGFNAGHGAVFNAAGTIELDAAIMNGADRNAGAVAGITTTRNPIDLARAVMDKSPHVMLQGVGADEFSREQELAQVPNSYFETDRRRAQLEKMQSGEDVSHSLNIERKYGTVGAVARDQSGDLAAATSTGGMTGKRFGRVGDVPVLGAGTYADNASCAVSATGAGEYYIRANVAASICARIRYLGEDVQTAADAVQADMKSLGGSGGVIVVGADGTPAYSFNSEGMYRGMALSDGTISTAIYGDEQ
ncbi:MAG: isoaspartyl peptidase/L-asparaginase [Pacificimonas sp.]